MIISVLRVGIKFKRLEFHISKWRSGIVRSNTRDDAVAEIRWQVIKAMLIEFPALKERVKSYLEEG